MKTDAFFYNLFKSGPGTFFELMGLSREESRHYRFDSHELKQTSLRLDGLFLPLTPGGDRPIWFLEIQFHSNPALFVNLFAKVFHYLTLNGPDSPWRAAVILPGRNIEPRDMEPCRPLLESGWVHRRYLEDLPDRPDASIGYELLRLIGQAEEAAIPAGRNLLVRARTELADEAERRNMVEWIETVFLLKFPKLNRREVEAMLKLEDLRNTRVWQEAVEEGLLEGKLEGKLEAIPGLLALKLTPEQIAQVLNLPLELVVKTAKDPGRTTP